MVKRAVLVVMLCVVPAALRATVLAPAEFREIVTGADVIAYGRVTETSVRWSDDRKRVETLVTLHVGTYLKGGPGDTIVFRVPGGQIGAYRNVMVGAPHFATGEEAVLFLKVKEGGLPFVFGLNQGVFRVQLDDRTKRRLVVPPALMARAESVELVVRGSITRRAVALEAFGAQVQTVLAEAAGRGVR